MKNEGIWLSILEYAQYRDISISTIRRYIKSERVRYKLDGGKYFIFVPDDNFAKKSEHQTATTLAEDNKRLRLQLQSTIEELSDLRLLVDVYEQKKKRSQRIELPPLPE